MKILFSLLVFLSIFNCAGSNYTLSFSKDQFLEKIQGMYESNYKNTAFAIWIEKVETSNKSSSASESIFVFVFEKNRRTEIEMLLRKYQDIEMLAEDTCSYVENLAWGTHSLWNTKGMGGLAGMSIPKNLEKNSTIPLETFFYIDFPVKDQYGFISLEINNAGEAEKITFFETGFIKKPWNYFLNSSMTLQKTSQDRLDLLSRFYANSKHVNNEIRTHQGDQKSYCN